MFLCGVKIFRKEGSFLNFFNYFPMALFSSFPVSWFCSSDDVSCCCDRLLKKQYSLFDRKEHLDS
jgi:hypothetical protein